MHSIYFPRHFWFYTCQKQSFGIISAKPREEELYKGLVECK